MNLIETALLVLAIVQMIGLVLVFMKFKYNVFLTLLMLVPVISLFAITFVAFAKTPLEKENEELRAKLAKLENPDNKSETVGEETSPTVQCSSCGCGNPEWVENCIMCGKTLQQGNSN